MTEQVNNNEDCERSARELIERLEQMHPEIKWSLYPLGDYDQYAEADAPDFLVSFGSDEQGLDGGLVDPYSTLMGSLCEPSAWGISDEAARLIQAHNRVFMDKYSDYDGPRFLLAETESSSPKMR